MGTLVAIVACCASAQNFHEPIKDPARLEWHEVTKVAHYYLSVNAAIQPMEAREDPSPYGDDKK